MLQTSELRIGNILTYAGKEIIVEGVVRNTIHHSKGQFDQNISPAYEPFRSIKITDKILLRIKGSFVAGVDMSKICIAAPYGFEFHFDKYGEDYILSVYCSTGCVVPQKSLYLNELQNLWFSLCGEELVFSTES